MVKQTHTFAITKDKSTGEVVLRMNDFHMTLTVPEDKRHGEEWDGIDSMQGFESMLFATAMLMKAEGNMEYFGLLAEKVGKVLDIYEKVVAEHKQHTKPRMPPRLVEV